MNKLRADILIPQWASFGAYFAYQLVITALKNVGWIYPGSTEKYISAMEYKSLTLLIGRDLFVAVFAGALASLLVVLRSPNDRVATSIRAIVGFAVGLGLCLGQALYFALLFRGAIPRFGLRANGWAQGVIYVGLALGLGVLVAWAIERMSWRSEQSRAR